MSVRSRRMLREQGGFTLPELMIALLIGMLITGALITHYEGMRRTFSAQDGMAQLQDSQRLILTMTTTTLHLAGYYVNPGLVTRTGALPAGATVLWTSLGGSSTLDAGQGIVGAGNGTGTGAASDAVAVRYQTGSGDGLMNCLGGVNPAASGTPAVWINVYEVNAANELTCSVNGAPPVPLVGNVQQMQIQYGLDQDADGSTDAYLPASVVTTANRWSDVHSARLSLVLLDPLAATPTAVPARLVQLIDLKNMP